MKSVSPPKKSAKGMKFVETTEAPTFASQESLLPVIKPKKVFTGFLFFVNENRQKIIEVNKCGMLDVTKIAGKQW